jgi:Zn-dependent protease/CBS domain-containing protein
MKSNIKIAKVFGVELGLHYSWLIIAALIVFSLVAEFHGTNPQWGEGLIWAAAIATGILFFACLFAHELSHALVAKSRGIPIHNITLFLLGGMAQIEGEPQSAGAEFWMAIVGPITSGVIGAVLLAIAHAFAGGVGAPPTPGTAILLWLGYINLALAAFNMIPGFPLDGGRVLRAIIWSINKNAYKSTMIAGRVGQGVGFLFIAYGIFRMFAGEGIGGLWIAFIGYFLIQAAGSSVLQSKASALLAGLHARDVMSTDCASISPDTHLDEIVGEVLRSGMRCFVVVDGEHMLGLLAPGDVRAVPSTAWPTTRVAEIMRPATPAQIIGPDTPASEAIELMSRHNISQLPVVDHGRLAGVVSRAQLIDWLRLHSGPTAA